MKKILTIAGSDPSGGAGIQADIKTITVHGNACSVITSLTAQNTTGVYGIHNVPPEFVAAQMDCVFTDIYPDAVKIGMVSEEPIWPKSSPVCSNTAPKPGHRPCHDIHQRPPSPLRTRFLCWKKEELSWETPHHPQPPRGTGPHRPCHSHAGRHGGRHISHSMPRNRCPHKRRTPSGRCHRPAL